MALPDRSCHETTSRARISLTDLGQRICKVKEHSRRMQGEEPAKVRETSLAPNVFLAPGEIISEQCRLIGYNFSAHESPLMTNSKSADSVAEMSAAPGAGHLACALCGSRDAEPILEKRINGGGDLVFRLLRCAA